MNVRFSLPVKLMLALGLITLVLLQPWGVTKAVADSSGDRLGCGSYCQNAGGYGAPGSTAPVAATVAPSGTVTPDSDGYVPVTVNCHLSVQCKGALLVCLDSQATSADPAMASMGMAGECGRSDLRVDAGVTRTIGVPLPAPALAFLTSHGPTTCDVMGDTSESGVGTAYQTLIHGNLTVAAPA